MLEHVKTSTRLGLGFGIVIAMLAGLGLVALAYLETLSGLTSLMYRHPFTVSIAIYRIDGNIARMHRSMKDVVLSQDPAEIDQALQAVNAAEARVFDDVGILRERFLGDPGKVERLVRGMEQWRPIRARVVELARAGRVEEAYALHTGEVARQVAEVGQGVEAITQFAANKAISFRSEAQEARRSALVSLSVLVVLATLLAIAVTLFTIRGLLRMLGGEPAAIAAAADRIARGNLELTVGGHTGIAAAVGMMTATLRDVARQAKVIAAGDYSSDFVPRSDKDELGIALRDMNIALREAHQEATAQDWLKSGIARLNETMRGDLALDVLAGRVASEIATTLEAQVGALYVVQEGDPPRLALLGSYAYSKRKNLSSSFQFGEGLVGQAALERQPILIRNVPEDYVRVTSALGESLPRFICVAPFMHEERVKGVLEVGTLHEFGARQLEYLQQALPILAITLESAHARTRLGTSLEESQRLTEELQVQQEELKVANEELEEQTRRLKQSEERLKTQQEELQVTNEELEEKNRLLERQKQEVERARKEITGKAEELALASKYKSEFLANMSHELRTPLNSLLLLAQSLAQNKEGNLSAEQVESARVIHGSGSDLLNLINEILDLSKIEAGRMDLHVARVAIADLAEGVRASFDHLARDKDLTLEVSVEEGAPADLASDRKRIEQIIRNLVANAIKFTERGGVTVRFGRPAAGTELRRRGLSPEASLAIAVHDTGIGVAPGKHRAIFEAFQQGDGGTSRRYGGTGLGLTISRELATLLGGEIQMQSEPGKGSTFTLYLPRESAQPAPAAPPAPAAEPPATPPAAPVVPAHVPDDRDQLDEADRTILVIEDDPHFAAILTGKCHEKGFKCLAASTGEAGLELAGRYLPSAVILDLHLPGMDGLTVLAALKENTRTRHIPVHVVSADEHPTESLRKGAVGHAVKPLDQERLEDVFARFEQVATADPRRVLVVEDDARARRETIALIGDRDVAVDEAASGEQAMAALREGGYDCVVLDLKLPDMDGREMLERLEREGVELPPVVVHTARDLTSEEEMGLREHAESIVIKDVRSPERLLDEVSLFLHRVVKDMPEQKRKMIRELHEGDALLRDKTVLIVDDDMRTSFALARLLAERGMRPLKAENGERALAQLEEHPEVDLVLMDIMMPVMDGYEAMRRIRARQAFRDLPIIALTAKAMPEDRQKCLAAGANDYLPKPVDGERLFSLMRVWLYG